MKLSKFRPLFRTTLLLVLLPALFFIGSACNLSLQRPSNVIVIAVDHLGVNEVNCAKENHNNARSGIDALCNESIRYTHAYTTSPLSAPALTSVLTAQVPLTHGLRHNGNTFLSSKLETVGEYAQKKGYATSFFSGGAPILRKMNLHQGFDTFDDNINLGGNQLFRSFEKSVSLFEGWLRDVKKQSFFTIFYVPDLVFTNTATQNDLGQSRNFTFESQLEEFDESLASLVTLLQKHRLWDTTTIVLVGLNGRDSEKRFEELSHMNLSSTRTHVSLLLKSTKTHSDNTRSWSFDPNVSLIDVGETLFAFLGAEGRSTDPDFPALALNTGVEKGDSPFLGRPILIESSWSAWQERTPPRYAFRIDQLLIVLDEEVQAYNSLLDRLEIAPLKSTDAYTRQPLEQVQKLAEKRELRRWPALSRETYLKWSGLAELWPLTATEAKVKTERLAYRLSLDPEVNHLFTMELLELQNWSDLERWSQGIRSKDLELIAQKNQKKSINWKSFTNGCLAALELGRAQAADLKRCDDGLALSFLEWYFAEKPEVIETARKKFLRQYFLLRLDRKITETNWTLQGVWDISSVLRGETPIIELMLSLPETQKYKTVITKAYQQQ